MGPHPAIASIPGSPRRSAPRVFGFGLVAALHLAALWVGGMMLVGCERSQDLSTAFPQPLTRAAVCAADGMILVDHPGPKGQLLLRDGETLYYCDTREFFEALHSPELRPRIAKRWVQPFDQRSWDSFEDGWAEPDELLYVLASRRMGSMGPTIVPFRERSEADRFIAREGGRVLAAGELTPQALEAYRIEIRDAARAGGMQGSQMQGSQTQGSQMKSGGMPHDPSQPGNPRHTGKPRQQ